MKEWFSPQELASLPGLPGTARRVRSKGITAGWDCRSRKIGKGIEFHRSSLPHATQSHLCGTLVYGVVVSGAPGPWPVRWLARWLRPLLREALRQERGDA